MPDYKVSILQDGGTELSVPTELSLSASNVSATTGNGLTSDNVQGQLDELASGGGTNDPAAIHDNVANEISAVTEKTTPVSADILIIEDSAAGFVKKKVQVGNLPDNDTTDHTLLSNIGTNTHAQIDAHIASTANPHSVTIDQVTPTTTKGDLIVENGSNAIRLGVGTNGQVLTADSTQASGVKWETPAGGGVFGTEYKKNSSEAETCTTSTSFQQKLRLTTGVVPAGDYIVFFSFEWNTDDERTTAGFRVQLDDSENLLNILPENGSDEDDAGHKHFGGHKVVTLTNASHNIDMDYRFVVGDGSEACIRAARLTMWRVS